MIRPSLYLFDEYAAVSGRRCTDQLRFARLSSAVSTANGRLCGTVTGRSDTKGPEAARKPAKRGALGSHMFSLYKLAQIIIMFMYTQKRSLHRDDVQRDASATAGTDSNSKQAKSLTPVPRVP
jgi:hypothetical protein